MTEVERHATKYKRVKNSGRMTGAPPLTEPYPFMVDHDWWNEKKNFPEYSEFLGTWLTRWVDPPAFDPLPSFQSKDTLDEAVDDDDEGYQGEEDER
jgi:hypothetical protein